MKVDRRTVLAGISVGIAAAAEGTAFAGPSPAAGSEKGPLVWLNMDQKELDDAYDQSKYAPNLQQITRRYASNSNAMRARLGEPKRFDYGPTAIERLEVYSTKRANAPIHIHIHGGAWHQRPAAEYAFPAEMLMNAGAHYVVPDFISVDEANGDLMPMVEQVRRAQPLQYPRADKHRHIDRQPAHHRGKRKDRDSNGKDAPCAEAVRHPAADGDADGETEDITGDDRFEAQRRHMQAGRHGGHGRIDDG